LTDYPPLGVYGKRTEIYIFGSADFRKEELRKESGKNTY